DSVSTQTLWLPAITGLSVGNTLHPENHCWRMIHTCCRQLLLSGTWSTSQHQAYELPVLPRRDFLELLLVTTKILPGALLTWALMFRMSILRSSIRRTPINIRLHRVGEMSRCVRKP